MNVVENGSTSWAATWSAGSTSATRTLVGKEICMFTDAKYEKLLNLYAGMKVVCECELWAACLERNGGSCCCLNSDVHLTALQAYYGERD